MKKLLPLLRNLLINKSTLVSATLLLMVMFGMVNQSQAQVYYLTSDANATTLNANDALNRMNYDGSGNTRMVSSFSNSPTQIEQDLAGGRLFIYEALAAQKSIKVVNSATGAITTSITVPYNVSSMKYDAATDYIYFLTTSGNIALDVSDALYKVKPTETTPTLITSSITTSPVSLTLDIPNNRVFIYEGVTANRGIKTFDLTSKTFTQTATVTAAVVDLEYDPSSGYIYYLTTDGSGTTLAANDALNKTLPGASTSTVIKAQVTASPAQCMLLDAGNNRAYIYEAFTANRAIKAVNLTTGDVTNVIAISTYPTGVTVTGMASAGVAMLTTTASSSVTATSATLGGNITRSDASVSERGMVYSSSNQTPTIADSKVTNGTGTGSFSTNISGLSPATIYYARAYATSSAGTAYGSVVIFATKSNDATLFNFSISAGSLSPSFNAATTNYTASVPNSVGSITVTPTVNNPSATVKVNGTAVTSSIASSAISLNVGSNTINTVVLASDGTTAKTYTLTVTRAQNPQTITFNAIPAKSYGDADFGPGATSSAGLTVSYSSDNTAVATIVNNQVHIVGVGTSNITASQAGNANTLAASNAVQSLTVNAKTITVTANAQTVVYGDNDPALTFTATGVVAGDTPTGALVRADGRVVGNYAIGLGTLSYGGKYNVNYVGANLTVTKRPVTILPIGKTKVYGDADPFLNQFQRTGGSLAPGDATGDQFGRAPGENVGNYLMTLGTKKFYGTIDGTLQDVTFCYNVTIQPAYVTITPKPITVTANAASKSYGDADPAFTYTVPAEITDATFTGSLSRAAGEEIGNYAITTGSLQINSNYTFSLVSADLTIGPKNLIVTPNAATKVYGEADPAFTYTTNVPIVGNATFTGNPERAEGKLVGTYAVTGLGTVALDNPRYTLTLGTGGALTITKRPITLQPVPATKTYGNNDPGFPYRFLNGTSVAPGEGMTGLFGRAPGENVGTYALTLGAKSPYDSSTNTYSIANYNITFISNDLTITAKPITVTADAKTKFIGDADPELTYSTNVPLAYSDSFTGQLARDPGEGVRSYAIKQGTLALGSNYELTYNGATFTILTSSNANLTTLSMEGISFDQPFSSENTSYTATVENGVYQTQVTAIAASRFANILVNGLSLVYNDSHTTQNINLNYGETTIDAVVTAQDGVTMKTYRTVINRKLDKDASLYAIYIIGDQQLNPAFDPATHDYTVNVPNSTTYLEGYIFANGNGATVKVNGADFDGYLYQELTPGVTKLKIDIIAQDTTFKQTYNVTVNRALSSNNLLTDLTLTNATISPIFNANTLNYTADVDNGTLSGTIQAFTTDTTARYKVNGVAPNSASDGVPVDFNIGNNNFKIDVTAKNGDVKQYTLAVTRLLSANSRLSNLTVSNGTLSPYFEGQPGPFSVTVAPNVSSITVTPTVQDPTATVTVNAAAVVSGHSSNNITLAYGSNNNINVVVTAASGATTTYTIAVTRTALANNTSLSDLAISTGTLARSGETFTASVNNTTSTIKLKASIGNSNATLKLNGQSITQGEYTDALPLIIGANTFTLEVTAQDGVTKRNVAVVITRAASSNVGLTDIAITPGTLAKGTGTDNLKSTVSTTTLSVMLKASLAQPNATLKLNGQPLAQGTNSAPLMLAAGVNNFILEITAEDGVTKRNITVSVTRPASTNVALTNIALSSGTLVRSGNSDTFTANVSSENVTVMLKATVGHPNATLKLNTQPLTQGSYSNPLTLAAGTNTFNLEVTAEDGVTKRNLTIKVTRPISKSVSISQLAITPGTLAYANEGDKFTASVANATSSVKLIASISHPNATLKLNGQAFAQGTYSDALPLNVGVNTFTLEITAEDGVSKRNISISVSRAPSSSVSLTDLAINPGSLSLSSENSYAASVNNSTTTVSLKASIASPNATLKLNGQPLLQGSFSAPQTLNVGSNEFLLNITAEDGINSRTLTITVNRAAPVSSLAVNKEDANKFYAKNSNSFTTAQDIVVHQGVSPNGDGFNDFLVVEGLSNADNKLSIMNTSGALVFDMKDYGKDRGRVFDGHGKNGKLLNAGTYYYSLDYKEDGKDKRKTGFIILKY